MASGIGHATTISGEIWQNVQTAAQSGLIASAPGTAADAEFSTNAINYDSRVTGYTPALFFNNPTFFNTSGTFDPNASLDNMYALFTGKLWLNSGGNLFSIAHDDGFELSIPGAGYDLQEGGPHYPSITTDTITAGSAGLYDFTLSYGEAWGPPAVLDMAAVPEPGTFTLFLAGAGLFALIAYRRRRTA
ncbi:MAG: PEP-CTERM sorting domain-containing protein [Nitrospiraceae bacterium]|nr:PEP-CTERM sorting domain-containing protein [Nitrospiraceae bacterium]